jgi:hypothetical protein
METAMNSNKNTAKLLAAVIGGSAVVTMGALTVSIHQQPNAATNLAVGKMTVAATTTASGKADTVEATSMAVPAIKGPAPLPAEEKAAE